MLYEVITFYGWTKDELTRMKISEINTLSQDEIKILMSQALDGSNRSFIFRHRIKSGEIRDVEVYSSRTVFENREALYSIIFDITDKKRYEETLNLYSTAIEQSPECIMIA